MKLNVFYWSTIPQKTIHHHNLFEIKRTEMVALNVNLLIGAFFTSNSNLDKKYIKPISYSLNLAE